MGAKKKKGKKGKKAAEEKVEEESEFKNMDLEMLREVVPMLRQQLEKSMLDRNYVQLERDTIQQFYEITRRDIRELEMAVAAKDREMELMEDNHRVEIRVYQQKVKHLEFEQRSNLTQVEEDATTLLQESEQLHDRRMDDVKTSRRQLRLDLLDWDVTNAKKVTDMKELHQKNLVKLREGFEQSLQELSGRCDVRLEQLQEDLELKRRVDLHEIEERKNLHINDLMRNHEKAFTQMKNYYNDITNGNLQLIRNLKDQVTELKKKASANAKLLQEYSQDNERLSEPLGQVSEEVADLRSKLREREKDLLALKNTKARLQVLQSDVTALRTAHRDLERSYAETERERDELYDGFDSAISTVRQQTEFSNRVLEQRVSGLEQRIEVTSAQTHEVIRAANLAPQDMARVMASLDDLLASKDDTVRELKYARVRAGKAYNDTLQSLTAKLIALGVPAEEIAELGFTPEELPAAAGVGPAGLVARV